MHGVEAVPVPWRNRRIQTTLVILSRDDICSQMQCSVYHFAKSRQAVRAVPELDADRLIVTLRNRGRQWVAFQKLNADGVIMAISLRDLLVQQHLRKSFDCRTAMAIPTRGLSIVCSFCLQVSLWAAWKHRILVGVFAASSG